MIDLNLKQFTPQLLVQSRELISRFLRKTPLLQIQDGTKSSNEQQYGLKIESMQLGGSFKIRGALSAVLTPDRENQLKGICAVSAGNHAIAVSLAGMMVGCKATVVIPTSASNPLRIQLCKDYGANVVLCDDREKAFPLAMEICKQENLDFIHPFDSPYTVMGAATVAAEIMEQAPQVDAIFVPIGGGGLLSGTLAQIQAVNPQIKIIGVEPQGSEKMKASLDLGRPVTGFLSNTIADSLTPPMLGQIAYEMGQKYLYDLVSVTDEAIIQAVQECYAMYRLPIEPSGACALAGLRVYSQKQRFNFPVAILSGSNIPLENFKHFLET